MKNGVVFLLLAGIFGIKLQAQNHYWSQQFGAHATLTGGTAVAGAHDNSCIYYNPGSAGFIDSSKISASANVYGFEFINMKNGAGAGLDLKSFRVNIFPQIVSGSIPIKKYPRLKILYATLTRFRTNIRFNQDARTNYNVIPNSIGNEFYRARLEYQNTSIEQWGGLGLAYKVHKNFSVGGTAFVTYTNIENRASENLNADAYFNGQLYTATVNEFNSMRVDQLGLVFKIGAAADFEHIKLGLAITMPSIKIYGRGRLDKSFEAYNMNLNATDTISPSQKYQSLALADEQGRLKTGYRLPASIAVGVKLVYGRFKFSATAEYFFACRSIKLIQGTDRAYVRPQNAYGGDTIKGYMSITTSAKQVLNMGLGLEWRVREKLAVLAGVRTDVNNRADYLPTNSIADISSLRLPVWHYLYFSAGVTYKLGTHDITAGFDYGLGLTADRRQLFNLTEPQQDLLLRGNTDRSMRTSVHSLSFVIGYTYYFKRSVRR